MLNIPGLQDVSFDGDIKFEFPPNMLGLSQRDMDKVRILDDRDAAERIIAIGIDVNDNYVALNGTLEKWAGKLSSVVLKKPASMIPVLEGKYVLVVDGTEVYVIDSLVLLGNANHASKLDGHTRQRPHLFNT